MKSIIIDQQAAQEFAESVVYWVDRFGLSEWSYEIKQEQLGNGRLAEVNIERKGKLALFQITHVCEGDYAIDQSPKALALHEVLHLMLSDYGWLAAKARDDLDDVVIAHEHEIIHRLMRFLE